jgi:hypothetical protein
MRKPVNARPARRAFFISCNVDMDVDMDIDGDVESGMG